MVTEESIRVQEISAEEINKKRKPLYKRILSILTNTILVILVLISFASIYYNVVFYPIYISGPSMSPTLINEEFGIMDQRKGILKKLERGQIIIIDRSASDKPDLIIKRIIALPGETIELQDSLPLDLVKITPVVGEPFVLDETYLTEEARRQTVGGNYHSGPAISAPLTLGDDEYYVMGDNRMNSTDSRIEVGLGPVNLSRITGKLVYIQGIRVSDEEGVIHNEYYALRDWRKY